MRATGYAENTAMVWKDPVKKSSVGYKWGKAPSLVEGIPATITLPVAATRVRAWALDAKGQRSTPVIISGNGTSTVLQIGRQYAIIWYEVEIR